MKPYRFRKRDIKVYDRNPDIDQSVRDMRRVWNHLTERQFIQEYHLRYGVPIGKIKTCLKGGEGA
ncbi:hypothetical protein [Paenibacillus sp. HJGM_3]|uniref:hypothetical protein n=1 Tax=Paenibacillus sp. HJGM_3 TaxID=3379816 RepID=UPI00385E42A5